MWLEYWNINVRRACLYALWDGPRSPRSELSLSGAALRQQSQGLSPRAAKRLRLAIETMVITASNKWVWSKKAGKHFSFKVNFITLTLPSPQQHPDAVIVKECLSPFLNAWQKRVEGLLYVWKAEVQDNGNIHFHITSNAWYHYEHLRYDWNKYVNRLGYVDRAKSNDPNSTDVHSTRKVRNLAGYLISYMNKKDLYTRPLKRYFRRYGKNLRDMDSDVFHLPRNYFARIKRQVKGVIWSCSKPLLKPAITLDGGEEDCASCIKTLYKCEEYAIKTDYAYIVPFEGEAIKALPAVYNRLKEQLKEVFDRQQKVPKKFVY